MKINKNEFKKNIIKNNGGILRCRSLDTIQVNLGFRCNQICQHCHVNASPSRTEMMQPDTLQRILDVTGQLSPRLIDITGGAPEYHPQLRSFIQTLRSQHHHIQVRTNLTVLLKPQLKDIFKFYKEQNVQLCASLPCYEENEVRVQRGDGVFDKSIEALQKLNSLGYGVDSSYPLTLVFNPLNPVLPPEQSGLEKEYHEILQKQFGIVFTRLITITNMPIGRFLELLQKQNQDTAYMNLLKTSFNPATLEKVMCRSQINIGWDGTLYDCDFNLALRQPVESNVPGHIRDFDESKLATRMITTGNHCFGCTAGHGSSCGGALL